MRSFTTHDLNKRVGGVSDAAAKAPVTITPQRKPRFVTMSCEHCQRIPEATDARWAYGADGLAEREIQATHRGGDTFTAGRNARSDRLVKTDLRMSCA